MSILNKIKIIYEDNEVMAISKPAGLTVHPDGKTEMITLVDWILEKYPEIENVGEVIVTNTGDIIKRPGIVHRLDKDTSGVLLIAKTQESFESLKSQFQEKKIQKFYRAFVYGKIIYDTKIIDTPIGRSKNDFRKWATNREIRGKSREAITEYKVLFKNDNFSYIEVFPKTGRTHQIRVHMKYDNHPIVGDHLYAGKKFDRNNPENNLFFETQALHAYQIEWFNLKGEKKKAIAELPENFQKAEKIIKNIS